MNTPLGLQWQCLLQKSVLDFVPLVSARLTLTTSLPRFSAASALSGLKEPAGPASVNAWHGAVRRTCWALSSSQRSILAGFGSRMNSLWTFIFFPGVLLLRQRHLPLYCPTGVRLYAFSLYFQAYCFCDKGICPFAVQQAYVCVHLFCTCRRVASATKAPIYCSTGVRLYAPSLHFQAYCFCDKGTLFFRFSLDAPLCM